MTKLAKIPNSKIKKYVVIEFVTELMSNSYYVEAKSIKEALDKTINKDDTLSFIKVSCEVFIHTIYYTRVIVQNVLTGRNYYYVRQNKV